MTHDTVHINVEVRPEVDERDDAALLYAVVMRMLSTMPGGLQADVYMQRWAQNIASNAVDSMLWLTQDHTRYQAQVSIENGGLTVSIFDRGVCKVSRENALTLGRGEWPT